MAANNNSMVRYGGINASHLSSNISPHMPFVQTSSRCQTSETKGSVTNMAGNIVRPRQLRLVDNAHERIMKRIDDQKYLDTTPNADINNTWNK